MENASKALIIAAAILISIMIISLGIWIFSMANNATSNVNMTSTEVASFNSKFEGYAGDSVDGSKVNALLTTIITHNRQDSINRVKVSVQKTTNIKISYDENDSTLYTAITGRADSGKKYRVVMIYGEKDGRIDQIKIYSAN